MPLLYRVPAPPLCEFVELLWLQLASDSPGSAVHGAPKERLLPQGTSEIVIGLSDEPLNVYGHDGTALAGSFTGGLLCGPHSEYFVIDSSESASVAGMHFKPGGLSAFLPVPAPAVHNRHAGVCDLWRGFGSELCERVRLARSPHLIFDCMETWLLSLRRGRYQRDPAVAFAVRELAAGPRPVAGIQDCTGFSTRRFTELFRDEVGLTPKLFSGVQRFQDAHKRNNHGDLDWAGIALDCGYFDQAHFNHDFRAFSGINPTTYVRRRTPHLNHVPMD
jgi:AraC-like DNA-binding protein